MSASSRAITAAGVLALFAAAAGGSGDPAPDASPDASAPIAPAARFAATLARSEPGRFEVRRIQGHLLDVERTLSRKGTGNLSPAQREKRNTALNWLREYRQRGTFPHNHTHAGERVPVFVDEHGTPCAVAYLLQRSGREDLVREIASADNNVYAWELADDTRFSEWLDETGLTLEEAAKIQPNYGPDGCPCIIPDASRTWRYVVPFSVGSVLAGTVVNGVTEPGAWERAAVGAVNGAFAVVHLRLLLTAFDEWDDGSHGAELASAVNMGLGLMSGYVALTLLRPRGDESGTSAAGANGPRVLRSHGPRILAPEPVWVAGGLGLQVRLVR